MNTQQYSFNLNTYKYPPRKICTGEELEKICLERLTLYEIMVEAENLNLKRNSSKWDSYLASEIRNRKLSSYTILLNDQECTGTLKARICDHIGHWMLSLCYCKNDELRYSFIQWEICWVTFLYKHMKKLELKKFLEENQFTVTPVTISEKMYFKEDLISCMNLTSEEFQLNPYYKTHFSQLPVLVANRKIFLHRGMAYFPEIDIIYLVRSTLWLQFLTQLHWNSKMLPNIMNEDRLYNIIANIPVFLGKTKNLTILEVNLENLDDIAEQHYPLCMQTIHNVLRRDHHLKYDCKMQYGVFLKWLGLPYEDALKFWENEFTQIMTDDLYRRKYSYLFKHQYGMVGGRLQYSPYSCERILNNCPGPGQYHGCPFKHWDREKLLRKLEGDRLSLVDIRDIEDLINERSYQKACTKCFCAKRNVYREDFVQSPNEYCVESFNVDKDLERYFKAICEQL